MSEGGTKSNTGAFITLIPAISILALAIIAVFNIGYFSKIGLHFLGVMDFSNLVYSFSFVVVILVGALGAAGWGHIFQRLLELSEDKEGRAKVLKVLAACVFVAVLSLTIIHFFFPQYEPKHVLPDRLFALLLGILAILLLAVELVDFRKSNKFSMSDGFVTFAISVLALYYIGRAVAENQIYLVKATYEFTTKERIEPVVGKILRSSSVGFIIFADDRIMFLPQGEIKRIKATEEPSNF